VKLLGVTPGSAVAVLAEVFNDQPHVLQMTKPGLGMPEPETLRVAPHQGRRPLEQLRRRRGRGRQLAQFIRRTSHVGTVVSAPGLGKASVAILT
jgi:hypothetical protein